MAYNINYYSSSVYHTIWHLIILITIRLLYITFNLAMHAGLMFFDWKLVANLAKFLYRVQKQ